MEEIKKLLAILEEELEGNEPGLASVRVEPDAIREALVLLLRVELKRAGEPV